MQAEIGPYAADFLVTLNYLNECNYLILSVYMVVLAKLLVLQWSVHFPSQLGELKLKVFQ
jgi:hypothetical protein